MRCCHRPTWLPGALLGVTLIFSRSRWGIPTLAGALALAVLAGHPQIAIYVWLVTGVYALAREGRLPCVHTGERSLRFSEAALVEWERCGGSS